MRVLTVFGTRPEAVKLAPVILAMQASPLIEHVSCVTGQHREMLHQVLNTFGLKPEHDLDIMRDGQGLTHITTSVLESVGRVVEDERPDYLIVQGDTTTAFAAALASFYRQIPVAHVEAGLRTGNVHSPWPEEMNRRLVGRLATIHFPPTQIAADNLRREGVDESDIRVTGNTVIDAMKWVVDRLAVDKTFAQRFGADLPPVDPDRRLILVTGHRRENFDGALERVCRALRQIADRGDVEIVYPVHLNPRVQTVVNSVLAGHRAVHLVPPMDYVPFISLMKRAYLIVTDSGGIQEEAPGLGKPVLITRDTTERPEAIIAGTAKLVGTDTETLLAAMNELLDNPEAYRRVAQAKNPFGDGNASHRIVETLLERHRKAT